MNEKKHLVSSKNLQMLVTISALLTILNAIGFIGGEYGEIGSYKNRVLAGSITNLLVFLWARYALKNQVALIQLNHFLNRFTLICSFILAFMLFSLTWFLHFLDLPFFIIFYIWLKVKQNKLQK